MQVEDGECPVCGGPTKEVRDSDEGRLYELESTCKAGCFSDEFSYGNYRVRVGTQYWEWGYRDEPPSKEIQHAIKIMKIKGVAPCKSE